MNGSGGSHGLPPVGTKVCLVGLKDPELNEQIGYIENYSRDGERILVALEEGPKEIVKVKPKQIEVIEEAPPQIANGRRGGGGGRPGLPGGSSRNNNFNGSSARNLNRMGSQRSFNMSNGGGMHRVASRDNMSHATDQSTELMETLRR